MNQPVGQGSLPAGGTTPERMPVYHNEPAAFDANKLIEAHKIGQIQGHVKGFGEGRDHGHKEGIRHTLQVIIDTQKAYQQGKEETQKLRHTNFLRTLTGIIESVPKSLESGENLITRVFIGDGDSAHFATMFFIERGFFFSERMDKLVEIVDAFCDSAENDFDITIERAYTPECGDTPRAASLVADGYTHYLQHGLGMSEADKSIAA